MSVLLTKVDTFNVCTNITSFCGDNHNIYTYDSWCQGIDVDEEYRYRTHGASFLQVLQPSVYWFRFGSIKVSGKPLVSSPCILAPSQLPKCSSTQAIPPNIDQMS